MASDVTNTHYLKGNLQTQPNKISLNKTLTISKVTAFQGTTNSGKQKINCTNKSEIKCKEKEFD